jgi:hypothetical protein
VIDYCRKAFFKTLEAVIPMLPSQARIQTQLAILPPRGTPPPGIFRNVELNVGRHDASLARMQRFRGEVYLRDGAIQPAELTSDGRHILSVDAQSWHVLSLDRDGKVVACLRYLEKRHAQGLNDLWVRHAALAACPVYGSQFRSAIELEILRARQMRMGFGEVGGWAVAETHRGTMEPLRIILATYGLLQLLGSSLGVATATFRHASASILRRIGLTSLLSDGQALPPYYDPSYGCQMEVLQFDSRSPNPKYHEQVMDLSARLTDAPVICREIPGSAVGAQLNSWFGEMPHQWATC